jgi:hypothetical protein
MNYAIYNVFHSRLCEEQYAGKESHYFYAKVGNSKAEVNSDAIRRRIVDIKTLSGYEEMGSNWAESEFLFALYRTINNDPSFLSEIKYIGVSQYDHSCVCKTTGENLIDFMNTKADTITSNKVLSLVPIDFNYEIYGNAIAMDFLEPQRQRGNPLCYFRMIRNYNEYYGTSFRYSDFFNMVGKNISLCSSFVMTKDNFMEMMKFSTWAADQDNLNQFDPDRQYRAAGGFMERYYGTWIALSGKTLIEFPIESLDKNKILNETEGVTV